MMENRIYAIIISELAGETLTSEETAILEDWLEASVMNRQTYRKLKRWYAESEEFRMRGGIDHNKAWHRLLQKREQQELRGKRRLLTRLAGIAAILIVSVGTGLFFMNRNQADMPVIPLAALTDSGNVQLELHDGMMISLSSSVDSISVNGMGAMAVYDSNGLVYRGRGIAATNPNNAPNRLIVPAGAEYKVVLSDGTKVFLNASSELTYPAVFSGSGREVFLKGEAYFEVKHDPEHPFVVRTSSMDIEVLGTVFNVNSYAGANTVATTLVSGKVRARSKGQVFDLLPGEQICTDRNSGKVSVRKVNTLLYTSWKDGYYFFEAQRLEDIMNMISHWYGFKVEFIDPALKDIEFSGRLQRYDEVGRLFHKFEQVERVRFQSEGNLVKISYR